MKDPNDFVTYHDALLGIFVLSGLKKIPTDAFRIHPFFYKWRDKTSLEQIKKLHFDTRGRYPLSDEIYTFKSWMFMWGAWYTLVPRQSEGDFYYWSDGTYEQAIQNTYDNFSKEEIEELKRIAEDFAKEMGS